MNIRLRDNQGNFRDFGVVLDEVGGKWKTLNNVEKNAIGVAMAGVRNRENFNVLMENYGKALEYTGVSANSSGTALKKYEIYEDSVEAKTKKFQATLEGLSSTILKSATVKDIIDVGTDTFSGLNDILKTFGTLPTLIGAVTIAMGLMNKQFGLFSVKNNSISIFGRTVEDMKQARDEGQRFGGLFSSKVVKPFANAESVINKYNLAVEHNSLSQKGFERLLSQSDDTLATHLKTVKGSSTSMGEYTSSLKTAKTATMGLSIVTTALNMALMMGVTSLITYFVTAKQRAEDAKQNAIDLANSSKEEYNGLKDLISQYRELSKVVNPTAETKSQLKSIQDKLIESYGLEANAIDLVNGKYENNIKLLQQASAEKAKKAVDTAQDAVNKTKKGTQYNSGNRYDIINGDGLDASKEWKTLRKNKKQFNSLNFAGGVVAIDTNNKDVSTKDIIKDLEKAQSMIDKTSDLWSKLQDKKVELQKSINENDKAEADLLSATANQKFLEYIQKTGNEIDKVNEGSFKDWRNGLLATAGGNKELEASLSTLAGETFPDTKYQMQTMTDADRAWIAQQQQSVEATDNQTSSMEEFKKSLEESKNAISDIASSMSTASSAFAEQTENGGLSAETIIKLTEAGLDACIQLDEETGLVSINTQSYENLTKAKIDTQLASIEQQKLDITSKLARERQEVDNLTLAYANLTTADIMYNEMKKGMLDTSQQEDAGKVSSLNARISALKTLTNNIGKVTMGSYGTSKSSKSSSAQKDAEDQTKKAQEALEKQRDLEFADLEHRRKMDLISEEQYLNEKEALNNKWYANDKENVKEYWSNIESIRDARQKLLEEAKTAIEKIRDMEVNLIKQEKEDDKKALEDKLDNIKKLADARKKALQDQQDQEQHAQDLAEKNKDISKLQNDIRDLDKDTSANSVKKRFELQQELTEKQKDLADFEKDYSIKTQEEQIDKEVENAQKLYDEKIKAIDTFLGNQENLVNEAMLRMNGMNQTLYQQLDDYNAKYSDGIRNGIKGAWDEAYNALQRYGSLANVSGTLSNMSTSTAKPTSYSPTSSPTPQPAQQAGINEGSKVRIKSSAQNYAGQSPNVAIPNQYKNKPYTVLDIGYGGQQALIKELYSWVKLSDLQPYADGGVNDFTGLAMLHGTKSKSETIFNANDSKKLYDLVHNSSNLAKTMIQNMLPEMRNVTNNVSSNNQAPTVNFDIIVQGNADNNTIKEFKKIEDSLVRKVCVAFNKGQFNKGK